MNEFLIRIPMTAALDVTVYAESETDAIEIAWEAATKNDTISLELSTTTKESQEDGGVKGSSINEYGFHRSMGNGNVLNGIIREIETEDFGEID